MEANSILLDSTWWGKGGCKFQVLPNPKEPGCFTARAIVQSPCTADCFCGEASRRVMGCEEISSLQVFIENESAPAAGAELAAEEVVAFLPAEVAAAFREFRLALEYFIIRPGETPADPVYPVWVRDIKRSTQVVEGKYAEIVPLSFEFVPTLNCIYRCHQCAYRQPKEDLGVWSRNDFSPAFHMDAESMRTLLDQLKEAGVLEVLFTSGGEPLLNDATPEGMQHAHDLELKVGLYTNGALVNGSNAKAIMNARPAYVRVSLNAGGRRVYYQHHNPLVVDPSVDFYSSNQKALYLLSREKASLQSETILGVSYLVGPDNATDVVNGARMVAAVARACHGAIGYMRFTPSVDYFGGRQQPRELFESAVNLIETEAAPLLADAGVEARVYSHRFSGLYESRPYDKCLAAGWYGGVGPGGVLYWCCEKLFNPSFTFGSLLSESFGGLWSSAARRRVAAFVGEAVKGGTVSPCPVVCKPHEHNKVFAKVEKFRERGEIEVVRTWLRQIHRIVCSSHAGGQPRLDGFQS